MFRPFLVLRRLALGLAAAGSLSHAAEPALTLTAESMVPAVVIENGRITGHAAEKVHEIMRRAGIAYHIKILPWKRAYVLAENEPSTCVFMTTRTPERESRFVWIGPISRTDWTLYGRAGRNYNVTRLIDARGLRIGGYNGDVRGEFLAARGFKVDFAPNDDSNPKKLMVGRIDLWVNSARSSRPVLQRLGLEGKVVPVLVFHEARLYLACNPATDAAQVTRMHAALRGMEADGTFKEIERRFDHISRP